MQLRESLLTDDDATSQLRPGEQNSCDYMNVSAFLNERSRYLKKQILAVCIII